jgi:hypothetical protein
MILACSSPLFAKDPTAKDPTAKAVYCTQGPDGQWSLHRFKPLIKVQGGTVFAEMSFAGSVLEEVKVRHFSPGSELAFDYTFYPSGLLAGMHASVTVKTVPPPGADPSMTVDLADWLGEADLAARSDGTILPHHVLYSREKDRIEKPDEADKYIGQFDHAPVYWTIQSVPCAAMLNEAEKMNATQE